MSKNIRRAEYDLLRITACMMVVMLHVSAFLLDKIISKLHRMEGTQFI